MLLLKKRAIKALLRWGTSLAAKIHGKWKGGGEGVGSLELVSDPDLPLFLFVADFGFARYLQNNMMAATLCGSPMYMVSVFCLHVFLYCLCFVPQKRGFGFFLVFPQRWNFIYLTETSYYTGRLHKVLTAGNVGQQVLNFQVSCG